MQKKYEELTYEVLREKLRDAQDRLGAKNTEEAFAKFLELQEAVRAKDPRT